MQQENPLCLCTGKFLSVKPEPVWNSHPGCRHAVQQHVNTRLPIRFWFSSLLTCTDIWSIISRVSTLLYKCGVLVWPIKCRIVHTREEGRYHTAQHRIYYHSISHISEHPWRKEARMDYVLLSTFFTNCPRRIQWVAWSVRPHVMSYSYSSAEELGKEPVSGGQEMLYLAHFLAQYFILNRISLFSQAEIPVMHPIMLHLRAAQSRNPASVNQGFKIKI